MLSGLVHCAVRVTEPTVVTEVVGDVMTDADVDDAESDEGRTGMVAEGLGKGWAVTRAVGSEAT